MFGANVLDPRGKKYRRLVSIFLRDRSSAVGKSG